MMIHANIFFLARRFEMETLKIESSKNFEKAAKTTQKEAARYFAAFSPLVCEIYEPGDKYGSEDKFLKDGLCLFLHNHRGDKELWALMQPLFQRHSQFAVDLLNHWNKEEDDGSTGIEAWRPVVMVSGAMGLEW